MKIEIEGKTRQNAENKQTFEQMNSEILNWKLEIRRKRRP